MNKNIYKFPLLASFIFLLISCDMFFPAPYGRTNPADDEAQIGLFEAVATGDQSITVFWDWRDAPSSIDDSRIIDEIRIVHNAGSRPDSRFPLNKDDLAEYTSNKDNSFTWYDLEEDRDHYFALYAHEEGGTWLAPVLTSEYLDYDNGNEYQFTWDPMYTWLWVDTSSPTNTVSATSLTVTDLPAKQIGFIRFDDLADDYYRAILDARIQGFSVTTAGSIYIVPMRIEVSDGVVWEDILDSYNFDYENGKSAALSTGSEIVDITTQLNFAKIYGSNTLAFIAADSTGTFNIDSLTFYDSTEAEYLLTVWEN